MSTSLSLAELEAYDPNSPQRKKERRFLCPLCGDGKPRNRAHRSLAVNTQNGAWLCHRCSEKGLLKEFWTEQPVLKFKARKAAAVARAFALPPRKVKEQPEAASESSCRSMWGAAVPLDGTPGSTYLAGRGIPEDVAHLAGVRFSASWYYRPAVLFPIYDRAGQIVVAVNGRFIDGRDDLKIRTAGPRSMGAFVTPGAFSLPPVAITEGPLDALSLWLCGVSAIALVGTSWPEWMLAEFAFGKPVLVATDADTAGDEAAAKLTRELQTHGAHTFRLRPEGAKDWNELLQQQGDEPLRARLAAYTEIADDDCRVDALPELVESGRLDEALFVTALINDLYTRELWRSRLRNKKTDAA
jgi:hypothetical protein